MSRLLLASLLALAAAPPASAQAGKPRTNQAASTSPAELVERLKALGADAGANAEAAKLLDELRARGDAARAPLLAALPSLKPGRRARALAVLGDVPAPAVRDALLAAARTSDHLLRLVAAEHLRKYEGDAAAAGALTALAASDDREVAEMALSGFLRGQHPRAWDPLLQLLCDSSHQQPPPEFRLAPLAASLVAILQVDEDAAPRRAADLVGRLPTVPEGAPRERLLDVLCGARVPATQPYLRAVCQAVLATGQQVVERRKEARGEEPAVDLEPLEALRPFTEAMAVKALAGLRGGGGASFDLLLRAAADGRSPLRRAALPHLIATAGDEEDRRRALRALGALLSDVERSLRSLAHKQLVAEAKQDLGTTWAQWAAWAEGRTAAPEGEQQ